MTLDAAKLRSLLEAHSMRLTFGAYRTLRAWRTDSAIYVMRFGWGEVNNPDVPSVA